MSQSVEQAVRLVRQAVLQDSQRNYGEAARCYREAINTFRELAKERSGSHRLHQLLATKLGQYESRLLILEHHLLTTETDLHQFLRDLAPSSCRSSVSSESRLLYSNPLLGRALDLLHRGRREDERGNFMGALQLYERGLASLLELLRKGHLTERQSESARVKSLLYHERCEVIRGHLEGSRPASAALGRGRVAGSEEEESLDSDCDSPVPPTESEELLRMEEVHSCSSRLGSTQSLTTPEPGREQGGLRSRASSSSSLARSSTSSPLTTKPSTHSLYPTCHVKHSPSVQSVASGQVPLAREELSLSCLSIQSKGEMAVEQDIDTEQIIIINDDCDKSYELIRLKDKDEDNLASEGSDSGYSGPSPDDGLRRDSKSPGSEGTDRKSPFSDISEEEVVEEVPLVPQVIVVQEGVQGRVEDQGASPLLRRQLERQRSRVQSLGKGILNSQQSQDTVAVLGEEQVDMVARVRTPEHRVEVLEQYGRREVPGERVVMRAEARGEHGEMNMGCYYLMAALDFCWCL